MAATATALCSCHGLIFSLASVIIELFSIRDFFHNIKVVKVMSRFCIGATNITIALNAKVANLSLSTIVGRKVTN
jgi:hypothetical protein